MNKDNKIDSKKEQLAGKAKEAGGKVTGDKKFESEGKTQNALGKAKEKLDDAKESLKGATKGAKNNLDKDKTDR